MPETHDEFLEMSFARPLMLSKIHLTTLNATLLTTKANTVVGIECLFIDIKTYETVIYNS